MNQSSFNETQKFKNSEEEVQFLRRELEKKNSSELVNIENDSDKEKMAQDIISQYKKTSTESVLHKKIRISEKEKKEIILHLSPETHDYQMEELLGILLKHGIKNALNVVSALNNPHIEDDFHRFLVQYLIEAKQVPGLKNHSSLFKGLSMKLFEITLPNQEEDDAKTFKDFIGAMEQFFAGMQSISKSFNNTDDKYFTLELAIPYNKSEVTFYAAIPENNSDLFEKQVLGFYENAKIVSVEDDYNIFGDSTESSGAYAKFAEPAVLPLKTHKDIEHDPMGPILNAFSKIKNIGEGAAIQFVISPAGEKYVKRYKTILDDIKSGEKLKVAYSKSKQLSSAFYEGVRDFFGSNYKNSEEKNKTDDTAIEQVTKKIESSIMLTNIRIITSSSISGRSKSILNEIESTFNQFTQSHGNRLLFKELSGRSLKQLFHDFSYRQRRKNNMLTLNLSELASLFHFPIGLTGTPNLKEARSGVAPAPIEMKNEGILLGINSYRGKETPVYIKPEDRMRHFYVIGQTGTGKTAFMKSMIIQDIKNGEGCCFIDPHGSDVQDILEHIPKDRIDDVIYFDPAYTPRPMALNMLEYDTNFPEQKTFVVNEMLAIFNRLFDMKVAGGPMFEQYFRNATMLVIDDPDSGNTLLEISRVLSDEKFRELKLSKCKNPIVIQFWREIAEKAGGEASLQNIVPYITSKFDAFLSNEIMRPIIAQKNSSFKMREVIDSGKILLINLSKGRLGEINANLLGLIIIGKILMAALSRVDTISQERKPFYLYIDEFQNVTTDSIEQILSEARKYKLSLTIAHQFIAQLEDNIKDAVFGNVGSMAIFRTGSDDAEYLESQLTPVFKKEDIMRLDNFNAYLRLLIEGQPEKAFSIKTIPPQIGVSSIAEKIKNLSYIKFGKPREEIEQKILERYKR